MLDFLARLQTIDRRWIYLFVAVACTLPFFVKTQVKVYVFPETQMFFDSVQAVKTENDRIAAQNVKLAARNKPTMREKVILLDSPWGPGSLAENKGQDEAVFEHCFRERIPLIIMALDGDVNAPRYIDDIIENLQKRCPELRDRKYGVDWVNLGITKTGWAAMMQMAKDFKKQFKQDGKGVKTTDYVKLPIMKKIDNINDVGLLVCINGWPSEDYVPFIHEQYGTKLAFGGCGMSSTALYRFIPSGQICGFLVSTRAAAEYDVLIHRELLHDENTATRENYGSKLIVPLAYGHLVIILAIVLGNIGYFAAQAKRRAN